jgi:hypothetical protein
MDYEYKSHSILVTLWPSLNPDGFIPDIRISNGAPLVFQKLKVTEAFPTKEEAEAHAIELAKNWIDGRITNG